MLNRIKGLLGGGKYEISQDELKEMVKADRATQLIDVRTPMEFRSEHINPCLNIDLKADDFDKKINYLEREKTYVLYCRNGNRSARARKKMASMGFDHVFELKGGISRWVGSKKVK